ncbi:homing endonuclease [Hypoxylon sp. EC38]|nr:homing endonuclease [Hypoxylon sp. EC38]
MLKEVFFVSIYKSKTITGYAVKLVFSIAHNSRNLELLNSCVKFLNCGRVSKRSMTAVELIVTKFSDIDNHILPVFSKYPLVGTKRRDYEDFCKIALLIKHKAHLTNEGLEEIHLINSGMNKRRI